MVVDKLHVEYLEFYNRLTESLPKSRVFIDPLHTLAYGTDASFYRLVPKVVVWVESSDEVSELLKLSSAMGLATVFRAAGTSLSGQAITDSILVVTSRDWNRIEISEDGSLVTLEPSVVGGSANLALLAFGRKIGPDPASIAAAMIGGIAANNASGMCCGVSDNSYKTVESMKIIFYDGSELDTASRKSRESFEDRHLTLVESVKNLSMGVKRDKKLYDKIVRKFRIKNTCGYSLNAFVDFDDPIDIILHLMIGSEGTLGFIKEITYKTVPEYRDKASSLMIFKNIKDACEAVVELRSKCKDSVVAAELMDRASLRCVENKEGMPEFLKSLDDDATALLVETRGACRGELVENIEIILDALEGIETVMPLGFTDNIDEYTLYWKIRKGLFPAVGAVREVGTTVVIEDVAYPIKDLAEATLELRGMFERHGYSEAIIFGHALEGNLHFVFTQAFDEKREIERYEKFMADVTYQVAVKYGGSLKAEHGTGRNMAPFVELEWGDDAYELMKSIKKIFDPKGLLNPGVILNDDKRIHLKNFKVMLRVDEIVDRCIECGFCETICPSNMITLTPRQRTAALRGMMSLGGDELKGFKKQYQYDGIETCATCSLCSMSCPVDIDTGSLIKKLRGEQIGVVGHGLAGSLSSHYGVVLGVSRVALSGMKWINKNMISDKTLSGMSSTLRTLSGDRLPLWTKNLPAGYKFRGKTALQSEKKVIYFSSCINRTMANPSEKDGELALEVVVIRVLERAGYEVIMPSKIENLCCGMPFSSKGYVKEGRNRFEELENELRVASKGGEIPILCDMSPCSKTMALGFSKELRVYDGVEFIDEFLFDELEFKQIQEPIVIHTTCSTRESGLAGKFERVAKMCSKSVIIPTDIGCCGFAGDRGFTFPELNRSALRSLKSSIPVDVKYGFSTSKTCEIGLCEHSGIDYRSIFYLVERCTR